MIHEPPAEPSPTGADELFGCGVDGAGVLYGLGVAGADEVFGWAVVDGAVVGAADAAACAGAVVTFFVTGGATTGAGACQSNGWTMVTPVSASYEMMRTLESRAHAARVASSVGRSVTL